MGFLLFSRKIYEKNIHKQKGVAQGIDQNEDPMTDRNEIRAATGDLFQVAVNANLNSLLAHKKCNRWARTIFHVGWLLH